MDIQSRQLILKLLNVLSQHQRITRSLLRTMLEDDPEIAGTWIGLATDTSNEFLLVTEDVLYALRSHARYGYVLEWLMAWQNESLRLRDVLAERLPGGRDEVGRLLAVEYVVGRVDEWATNTSI